MCWLIIDMMLLLIQGAAKFMEPFKHKVDSVMGPVVGEVDHDMVAHRPESDLSNLFGRHHGVGCTRL